MQKILYGVSHLETKDGIHFLSRVLTLIAFPISSLVLQLFMIVFQELHSAKVLIGHLENLII